MSKAKLRITAEERTALLAGKRLALAIRGVANSEAAPLGMIYAPLAGLLTPSGFNAVINDLVRQKLVARLGDSLCPFVAPAPIVPELHAAE